MDAGVLEELGLTSGEVTTYIALLEIGEAKIGAVIGRSGLAPSATHNALHALSEKGLVSYVKRGKVRHYTAIPPRHLLAFLEEKRQRLARLLPALETRRARVDDHQEAEVFEGTKGIMAMLYILVDGCRKGGEYLFFAVNVPEQNAEIQRFFRRYDAKRKAQGLVTKGIAPRSLKPLFRSRSALRMKYLGTPIPSNISICNGKIALFSWGERPIGYLITSKQLSEMYRGYFHQMWEG